MIWEEDHNHQARSLVKVRVTSLDVVPCFFNFSKGEEPEADSWTIFFLEKGIYINIPASASTDAYSYSLLHHKQITPHNQKHKVLI
jgi:hypothetical protein